MHLVRLLPDLTDTVLLGARQIRLLCMDAPRHLTHKLMCGQDRDSDQNTVTQVQLLGRQYRPLQLIIMEPRWLLVQIVARLLMRGRFPVEWGQNDLIPVHYPVLLVMGWIGIMMVQKWFLALMTVLGYTHTLTQQGQDLAQNDPIPVRYHRTQVIGLNFHLMVQIFLLVRRAHVFVLSTHIQMGGEPNTAILLLLCKGEFIMAQSRHIKIKVLQLWELFQPTQKKN